MLATAFPIVAVALIISVVINAVLLTRKPDREYFTVDSAGRVIPIRALSEPFVTDTFLLNWVNEQVSRAYSMDPVNYRRQAEDLSSSFTQDGYQQFIASLQESGTIEFMTKNLLVSTATARGTPVIVEQGEIRGTHFWKVQIPMLVQYRSAIKGAEKKRMVAVTVVRRQTLENPLGIGISQIVSYDN
jgi:hypothetical protein